LALIKLLLLESSGRGLVADSLPMAYSGAETDGDHLLLESVVMTPSQDPGVAGRRPCCTWRPGGLHALAAILVLALLSAGALTQRALRGAVRGTAARALERSSVNLEAISTCLPGGAPPKGVCLFDLDGTITVTKDVDAVLEQCLSKNFAVGIATAGGYSIATLCPGGAPAAAYGWMTPKFCQHLSACSSFNGVGSQQALMRESSRSASELYGGQRMKAARHDADLPGWLKGFAMDHAFHELRVPSSCGILFDDDPGYLRGATAFAECHQLPFIAKCANQPRCAPGNGGVPPSLTADYTAAAVDEAITRCNGQTP